LGNVSFPVTFLENVMIYLVYQLRWPYVYICVFI